MDPQVYFHGYDYSTGTLAAGAPCVAPILELTNKLPEEIRVAWLNRTLIGDDVLLADQASACSGFQNHLVVGVNELTLITNFYASSGFYRSFLRIESASSGVDHYVFNFTADAGYYFKRLPRFCYAPCQIPSSCPEECGASCFFTKALAERDAFAPCFRGGQLPKWKDCVIFPISVRRGPAVESYPCVVPESLSAPHGHHH